MLARAQVFHDPQFGEPRMSPLEVLHDLRQDADDAPAAGERALGECAHRTQRTAAVNDRVARPGQNLAELTCGVVIYRVALLAGSAIDADTSVHEWECTGVSQNWNVRQVTGGLYAARSPARTSGRATVRSTARVRRHHVNRHRAVPGQDLSRDG